MAETIESFVQKLQSEGVQAGREQAEALVRDAQATAAHVLEQAKAEAQQLLAESRALAQREAQRERGELDLACRDVVLRLRAAVSQALTSLLAQKVDESLRDSTLLIRLIEDAVTQYAQADARHDGPVRINVNPESVHAVTDWALKHFARTGESGADIRDSLKSAGFEYKVSEATVEVTVESIVELLKEQLNPQLREVLDRALAGGPGNPRA